jgi:hypothetical protein
VSTAKALKIAVIASAFVAVVFAASASSIPIVGDVLNVALLQKFTDSSGMERAMTISLAFGYFQQFPILGIGWGSATSHDLLVKLLSNVGLVGTFAFLGAIFWVLRANWRAMSPLVSSTSLSRAAWSLGLAAFLFTSVLITFPLAFGNFWLVLGMAISTGWTLVPARKFPAGPEVPL